MKLLNTILNTGTDPNLSKGENKVIKLLNTICVTFSVPLSIFIITNYLFNQKVFFETTSTHFTEFLMLILVQYLQYRKRYKTARFIFIYTSLLYFFVLSTFAVKGQLLEFFYILIPIFSLLFLNKNRYHYFFLGVSIFFFSVVPEFFNVYPETRTSSAISMPNLFIMIFLMFKYFKDSNTKNELLLEKEREVVEQDKIKIEQQAADLKELNEFQTHFFINITHELRTPLTLIKGNISGAKKMDSLEAIRAKLDGVLKHSNKIEYLINDIIDVTKAKTNTLTLNLELHTINNIIQKQYVAFKSLFEDKEINFSFTLFEKNITVEIDKLYFERVLGNILVNAAKYTSKGGNVTIFIAVNNNQIQINIEDDGIGIALDEEVKIFNRFYQVKNDINKASGSGYWFGFLQRSNTIAKRRYCLRFKTNMEAQLLELHYPKNNQLHQT